MSTSTRITLATYEEMILRGEFEPREEHQVELIYGEITEMSPIYPPHEYSVDFLCYWSIDNAPRAAVHVRTQGSFSIPLLDSLPQPDIVWLRREDYSRTRPLPGQVLLVIEVSDSSLAKDRGVKARLYAEGGIADYWIVNVRDRCVEVHRDPFGSSYRSIEVVRAGQEVRPLAFPEIALPVERIFPS